MIRDERGSASVATAGIIAALVSLALVAVELGAARVDSHRSQVAADLAAVAGATAHALGEDGCAAAQVTAQLNDAVVAECAVDGGDVTVTAEVHRARRVARAGPLMAAS
ncbi:Rv3654c family TadE-like protein [Corynebacterium uterequi]|uniref:Helicase/secretion neighborhood TadE-like protein n=1 Tax=Corynebacterium uterequi TaxID=1072256 RepID=A0A0G3HA63_9CORY|nr:Rv3654c family TadE-like protein [Corynebacterium uterequi]AKK10204.1 helicase/secretion neighborhood TadE-like protein [Corynebacterium uterequi]